MRRHLTQMSFLELREEHARMVAAIERLKDTRDQTGLFQLKSVRALKFAIECAINVKQTKLAATPNKVVRSK